MKSFKKYSGKQFTTLLESLGIYELTAGQDILHRIRIDIKKLKSLFYLINYCSKNFKASKEFNPLKRLFNKAGKIREIDVANKLFLEYHIKFKNEPDKIDDYRKLVSDFRQNTYRYKKAIVKIHKNFEKHIEKVSNDCLKEYINIKKDKLQKEILPKLDETDLHEIRKNIKEIIYLSGIPHGRKEKIISFYDQIQDVIGKWHDKKELMKLIEENNLDNKERIVEKLESKCLNELKTLDSMISNFHK